MIDAHLVFRFQYIDIPQFDNLLFNYVEIDWNTEGLPRGPNNSFVYGHYDFHFYLQYVLSK